MCKGVCVKVFVHPTKWGRNLHSPPYTGDFWWDLQGGISEGASLCAFSLLYCLQWSWIDLAITNIKVRWTAQRWRDRWTRKRMTEYMEMPPSQGLSCVVPWRAAAGATGSGAPWVLTADRAVNGSPSLGWRAMEVTAPSAAFPVFQSLWPSETQMKACAISPASRSS